MSEQLSRTRSEEPQTEGASANGAGQTAGSENSLVFLDPKVRETIRS